MKMEPRVWREMAFELPADWEMLQVSYDSAAGRCAFADRYSFRFELNWRQVPGAPDFSRMMSDYKAKLTDDGLQDAEIVERGGWHGIEGASEDAFLARYGRHLDGLYRLVELVFIWPDGRDEDLEEAVLDRFRAAEARPDGLARWRAFGMDLLAPGDVAMTGCDVKPACAELRFSDSRERTQETFGRLGLVSQWLSGSVADWLRQRIPEKARELSCKPIRTAEGHEGFDAEARIPGPGLIHRSRPYRARAWMCPHDGRLYTHIRVGPPGDASGGLSCCSSAAAETPVSP
jgi:hypothetical protein